MPIAEALGAMALQQFGTDINRKLQRDSDLEVMEKQQQYNMELMQYQNDMARKNYYDSPDLMARGLEKAGINPASAFNGSTPSPVAGGSIGSTPSHSSSTPTANNFNAVLLQNQMAQTENLKAATAKLNADAEKTQIENENSKGANEAVKSSILGALDMQEDVYKAYGLGTERLQSLREFIQKADKVNVGTLSTLVKSFDMEKLLSHQLTEKIEDIFDANLKSKFIEQDIAQTYLEMSDLGKKFMKKRIALTIQQAALLASETQVNKEQIKQITQNIKNLQQDIENARHNNQLTDQEYEHLKNSDINTYFENGQYGKGFRALGISVLQSLSGAAPLLLLRGGSKTVKEVQKQGAKKSKKFHLFNSEGQPTFYEDSDDFNRVLR